MVKLSLNKPLFNISHHFSCKSFRVSYTPASFFANYRSPSLLALQTSGSFVGRVSSKFSPDLAPFTIPNSVQKKKLFDMVIPWVCLASAGHQIALWVCYLLGFKRKHTNVQSQHHISLKHSWIEGFQRNRKIELLFFNRNQISWYHKMKSFQGKYEFFSYEDQYILLATPPKLLSTS